MRLIAKCPNCEFRSIVITGDWLDCKAFVPTRSSLFYTGLVPTTDTGGSMLHAGNAQLQHHQAFRTGRERLCGCLGRRHRSS
jgi:hypothetical protein